MKKNLALISLMLGVLLVLTVSAVSADTQVCGNGKLEGNEECDDGNIANGDGCSSTCEFDLLCPLNPGDFDDVVEIGGSKIRSDGLSSDAKSSLIPLALGPGKYSVTLVARDYSASRESNSQPNEQYQLSFIKSSVEQGMTPATTDLADNVNFAQVEEQVTSGITLANGADSIQAVHSEYDNVQTASPNSLYAVCAGINKLPCELTITNPQAGGEFDSEEVPIDWQMGGYCLPFDEFHIWYLKDDGCNVHGSWLEVPDGQDLSPGEVENPQYPDYQFIWDRPQESGQYCVKVKLTSNGIVNYSGVFNVDLAKPYVNLSVGSPQTEDCFEGEGDCWVTPQTEISLACHDDNPQAPWQSGPDTIMYSINGGEPQIYNGAFSFEVDSEHDLEYWCYDQVGKESEHKFKDFFVNSQAPTLDKTVGEPKVQAGEGYDWYATQDTEFCLSATSGNPEHPTPGEIRIDCGYGYWLSNPDGEPDDEVPVSLDEHGCFKYNEDSWHYLTCTATDALENSVTLTENDIVDSVAPETSLNYEEPYYSNEFAQWIDTVSTVVLSAYDPEPHPVEGVTTYYRVEEVSDAYCWDNQEWSVTSKEAEDWSEYDGEFGIPESCHVIEYYSVDALGNSEDVQFDLVFSDHTAPSLTKEVGKPSTPKNDNPLENWYENPGQKIEWGVTVNTPIVISCADQDPHPSGIGDNKESGIHWRVVLDGEYNSSSAEWKFSSTDSQTIWFEEQSEHLLEFYCVDNVGKVSETDSELFKVTGEAFDLEIGDKWDLISVPFNLLSNNISEVFGDDGNITGIWGYDPLTGWHLYAPGVVENDLTTIKPGYGYWIKTDSETTVVIGGSLFSPQSVPATVELESGWNLIGHYGLASKNSWCSLFSLVDTSIGFPRWSSLWEYDSFNQNFIPLDVYDDTNPGRGYWVEMDVSDTYAPSSVCWGLI